MLISLVFGGAEKKELDFRFVLAVPTLSGHYTMKIISTYEKGEEEAIKTKPAREGRSVESRLTFERTSLLASKLSPIWERIRFSAGGGYARDRPRTEKVKMRS